MPAARLTRKKSRKESFLVIFWHYCGGCTVRSYKEKNLFFFVYCFVQLLDDGRRIDSYGTNSRYSPICAGNSCSCCYMMSIPFHSTIICLYLSRADISRAQKGIKIVVSVKGKKKRKKCLEEKFSMIHTILVLELLLLLLLFVFVLFAILSVILFSK